MRSWNFIINQMKGEFEDECGWPMVTEYSCINVVMTTMSTHGSTCGLYVPIARWSVVSFSKCNTIPALTVNLKNIWCSIWYHCNSWPSNYGYRWHLFCAVMSGSDWILCKIYNSVMAESKMAATLCVLNTKWMLVIQFWLEVYFILILYSCSGYFLLTSTNNNNNNKTQIMLRFCVCTDRVNMWLQLKHFFPCRLIGSSNLHFRVNYDIWRFTVGKLNDSYSGSWHNRYNII